MLFPDYNEFSRLARTATLVPVAKTVAADLRTPVSAFLSVAADEPNAFLLESVPAAKRDRRLWVVAPACLLASAINPNGLLSLTILPNYQKSAMTQTLFEWQKVPLWPPTFDLCRPFHTPLF